MTTVMPASFSIASASAVLDGVGERDQSLQLSVGCQVHHAGALQPPGLGLPRQWPPVHPFDIHQRGIAESDLPAVDDTPYADAAGRFERLGFR